MKKPCFERVYNIIWKFIMRKSSNAVSDLKCNLYNFHITNFTANIYQQKNHIPFFFCKNKLMRFSGTAQQPQEDILQLAIQHSGIGPRCSQLSTTQDGVTENLESQTITQDTESDTGAKSDDLLHF